MRIDQQGALQSSQGWRFIWQRPATAELPDTANRGAASGLYLAVYFMGGLVGAAVAGQIFDHLGWPAAVIEIGASSLLLVAAVLTKRLVMPVVVI